VCSQVEGPEQLQNLLVILIFEVSSKRRLTLLEGFLKYGSKLIIDLFTDIVLRDHLQLHLRLSPFGLSWLFLCCLVVLRFLGSCLLHLFGDFLFDISLASCEGRKELGKLLTVIFGIYVKFGKS
jgi:hypothetical protein